MLFLNQAVVALALGELVNSLTPWRATAQQILLDLVQPRLTTSPPTATRPVPCAAPTASAGQGRSASTGAGHSTKVLTNGGNQGG